MRVAVTGGGGQLGGELCRQWGEAATPLDLPEFDLLDVQAVRRVLLELRPQAVVNTAAYTAVDRAEEVEMLCCAVNAEAVRTLAGVCRELGCPLVQISTDYVFGRDVARERPYREDDEPGPLGVYGQSKLAGEVEAAAWEEHLIVRTCGLYGRRGPRTAGSSFAETMLRLASEGKHLRVVDDQHCTPTYVPHVAGALRWLVEHGARGTYHVVNAGATTWHDFAVEMFRQAGLAASIERISTAQYGARAPRPLYSVLDTSKYQASGGPAMPSWQEAVGEYLASRGEREEGLAGGAKSG
ncbi:MAG: dTDP-4-dehydrorhamnose reductase [Pirellulales bacterium]